MPSRIEHLQRSAKVFVRGCEKFVIALAYLLCMPLLGSCLARFAYFLADLCMYSIQYGELHSSVNMEKRHPKLTHLHVQNRCSDRLRTICSFNIVDFV